MWKSLKESRSWSWTSTLTQPSSVQLVKSSGHKNLDTASFATDVSTDLIIIATGSEPNELPASSGLFAHDLVIPCICRIHLLLQHWFCHPWEHFDQCKESWKMGLLRYDALRYFRGSGCIRCDPPRHNLPHHPVSSPTFFARLCTISQLFTRCYDTKQKASYAFEQIVRNDWYDC